MATKRKPLHQTAAPGPNVRLNFRAAGADISRAEAKGTKPTAKPTSVKEVLIMMVLHVCKKIIFFDVGIKVALYLASLFLVSLIGDFIPYPKTYLARSDNLFNVYFVKMGWAWTLVFSTPFLLMTSYTLCCGNMQKLIRHHLPRLIIATGFWFIWTKTFNMIESSFGRCNIKNFDTKSSCLKAGHLWHGFDISGHAFILIYSSLLMMEEARPIVNWETINEHLRNEEYTRNTRDRSPSRNPLRNLPDDELLKLKYLYKRYTPAIRLLFVGMTALQLLWDIMLVGTMLYYHRMIEKVLSGIIAILTWFFTYRTWYPSRKFLPESAGRGQFLYQNKTKLDAIPVRRQSLVNNSLGGTSSKEIPKFMGMPLYNARPQKTADNNTGPQFNNYDQPSTSTGNYGAQYDRLNRF